MASLIKTKEYRDLILNIKAKIQTAQIKAAIKVNEALLRLYWDLAQLIVEKQKTATWGESFLGELSKDLKKEFPDMKGFSLTNIKYMRNWYLFYNGQGNRPAKITSKTGNHPQLVDGINVDIVRNDGEENRPHLVDEIFQIPWGHNREIITKCQTPPEAIYYVRKTIENNWSRAVLVHQIESKLMERAGQAVTNFQKNLPKPQSDLALETIKDPYNFDFLSLTQKHDEKELEQGLINHITKFLLELGKGFSFIGKQYRLVVGDDEFFSR